MRILASNRSRRAGWSLIEIMVAMGLMALVMASVFMTMESGQQAIRARSAETDAELRSWRALERIVDEVRAAARSSLAPAPSPPFSTSDITFQEALGFEGGAFQLGNPMRIRLIPGTGRVVRTENPGLPGEQSVGLCTGVSALLEGEVLNNADDNANGLTDEGGLCFTLEGDLMRIRLTITVPGPDSTILTRTMETSVFLRN